MASTSPAARAISVASPAEVVSRVSVSGGQRRLHRREPMLVDA